MCVARCRAFGEKRKSKNFADLQQSLKLCFLCDSATQPTKESDMHFTYTTNGVCSSRIDFDLNEKKLSNIVFTGGCNGNLKAIAKLLDGADAEFAMNKLKGNLCGYKDTSCADQFARAVEDALKRTAE